MKSIVKYGALAAVFALPNVAGAATVHDVTAPVAEDGIASGGVYGTTLGLGDIASVDVITATDGITSSVLGFDYSPANASQSFELTLNGFETGLYGEISAYLSNDDVLSADDVEANSMSMTNDSGRTIQNLFAESKFNTGRFYVLLDWTTEADNDFSYDVAVSPAPVPVPAAGFLLVGALGGMAALRRRKKT